jgi:DnaJ-class molecular chaperone
MANCPACNATGFETCADEIPCAACEGTGNLMGGPCPECGGSGTIQADSYVVCDLCQGTGKVMAGSSAAGETLATLEPHDQPQADGNQRRGD